MGSSKESKRSPLFGAAVLKALLSQRDQGQEAEKELYRGILRDLGVSDEEVEQYLARNQDEIDQAIGGYRKRGD